MTTKEKNRLRVNIWRNNRTPEQKLEDSRKRKEFKRKNAIRLSFKNKQYYEQNKKEIAKRAKERYDKNKETLNKRKRENHANKSDKQLFEERVKRNNLQKLRKQNDPCYKLSVLFRSRISRAIKEGYGNKSYKVIELIGCDWKTAKEWIESQWKEGMSWENHGIKVWHIDHKIPVSFFNMSIIEEQKKCFHYTNLQPLWAKDNMEKSNKLL
jgi:hypothetical protein